MASQGLYTPMPMAEVNAAALEEFIYTPVRDDMISYLANAAREVIRCDEKMMPPPPAAPSTHYQSYNNSSRLPITPPRTPPPVAAGEKFLPSLEQFIRNLVWSSNVQVPTLMSTLVYLNRLKSRLQPEAKGLRCTAHRIFLAALILTAKYLNDSSPKNKHWAKYTQIWDEANGPRCIAAGCHQHSRCNREGHLRAPDFEFSKTEVNLMEKQLLMLLEWELRITKDDLYRELSVFLTPFREKIILADHERSLRVAARRARQEAEARKEAEEAAREQDRQLAELFASTYTAYATPPQSPGRHSRNASRSSSASRSTAGSRAGSVPRLVRSSHSYASSLVSNMSHGSGNTDATTPPPAEMAEPHFYNSASGYDHTGLYEPPVEIIVTSKQQQQQQQYYAQMPQVPQMVKQKSLLPYEISPDELREIETGVNGAKRSRVRGMFGRIFNGQQTTVRA